MKRDQTQLQMWRFQVDQNNIGEEREWFKPEYNKSGWMEVEAPKAWDLYEPAFWSYEGTGWYAAELPADKVNLRLLQKVVFNSVSGHAKVWVNGVYIGEHYGAYLPFEFVVTPHLNQDSANEIVMRVDNRHREDWLPGGPVVEWVQYGGILQKVTLDSIGLQHISSLRIRTDVLENGFAAEATTAKAAVTCEVEIVNGSDDALQGTLVLELPEENGIVRTEHPVQCAPHETVIVPMRVEITDAILWDLDRPHLYTMSIAMKAGQNMLDQVNQRFGVRTISTKGNQILLNGKPIFIQGFNRYDEYAHHGLATTESVIREELLKIKSMGANFIRGHYPPEPIHLEIMDEIGMLYMDEVPLNWWLSETYKGTYIPEVVDKAENALEVMIRRDRNHPCLIAWSMCNESGTNTEQGIVAMRRLMKKAKELDPTRLVTFVTTGSPGHAAFDEADLICINLYYGLSPQKMALEIADFDELVRKPTESHLRATAQEYEEKPVVLTEFGTHSIYGLKGSDRFSEEFQAAYLESVWQAVIDSGVQGAVLWCWADYYHRRDFIGKDELMWNAPFGPYGVVTIDRREKEGFHTMKRLFQYHLRK